MKIKFLEAVINATLNNPGLACEYFIQYFLTVANENDVKIYIHWQLYLRK